MNFKKKAIIILLTSVILLSITMILGTNVYATNASEVKNTVATNTSELENTVATNETTNQIIKVGYLYPHDEQGKYGYLQELDLYYEGMSFYVGMEAQLFLCIYEGEDDYEFDSYYGKDVEYVVSDESIAVVDKETKKIKALKEGMVYIKAIYNGKETLEGAITISPASARQTYKYLQGEDIVEVEATKVYKVGSTYELFACYGYSEMYQEDKRVELPEEVKLLPAKNGEYSIDSTGRKLTFLKPSTDEEIEIYCTGVSGQLLAWYTVASGEEWEEYTTVKVSQATTESITNGIEENKTTIVEMETPTKIEKEVFTELKNTEGSSLEVSTGTATWEFESEDITNTNITFNPEVIVSNEKFSDIQSNEITDAIFIEFKHDGNLPGKATVTMNIGKNKYGEGEKTLKLYYYNEETKKYEFMQDVKYNNGIVTFSLTHCSTYTLTDKKLETSTPIIEGSISAGSGEAEEKLDNSPKMGVNDNIIVIISTLLSVISLGAVVAIKKMK